MVKAKTVKSWALPLGRRPDWRKKGSAVCGVHPQTKHKAVSQEHIKGYGWKKN